MEKILHAVHSIVPIEKGRVLRPADAIHTLALNLSRPLDRPTLDGIVRAMQQRKLEAKLTALGPRVVITVKSGEHLFHVEPVSSHRLEVTGLTKARNGGSKPYEIPPSVEYRLGSILSQRTPKPQPNLRGRATVRQRDFHQPV